MQQACSNCKVAVQDREVLDQNASQLCGGGTGGTLQLPDLPIGYTLGYEKANGCPVSVSVSRYSRPPWPPYRSFWVHQVSLHPVDWIVKMTVLTGSRRACSGSVHEQVKSMCAGSQPALV